MKPKIKLHTHILLCAAAASCFGQTSVTLSGIVRDPQMAVIPAARVMLTARESTTRWTATTNSQGEYRFEHLLPGAYLLQARASGFADSPALPAQIEKGSRVTIDVALQLAGLQSQVVVTASGTAQTTDELSKALSVVDAQTLDEQDQYSVSDALRNVPGLRVQTLGGPGAFTSIKTRGLKSEDTAVLIDGFRLRDAAATQGDASALLEDLIVTNVDRVEVLRGAGSSLYGTNATGGVVNIITGAGGGEPRGSVLLEGGSLGMLRGRAEVAGSLKHDKLRYSLGAAHLNVMSGVNDDAPARVSSLQGRIDYIFSPKARLFGRIFSTDSFSKLMDSAQGVGTIPASGIVEAIPLSDVELRRYEAGTPVAQLNLAGATLIPAADNPDYTRAARIFSGVLSLSLHPADSLESTSYYQGLRSRRRFGDGPAGAGYQTEGSTLSFYDGTIHTAGTRADWR